MVFEPKGLATGIGSLPHTGAEEALSVVKKYVPCIPHWPQLPQRGRQENIAEQFLKPLVNIGLLVDDGDRVYFDTTRPDWADNLTAFYSLYLAYEDGDLTVLDQFAFEEDSAAGFYAFMEDLKKGAGSARVLKGQVVGPLTAAFQLKDERGRFAYYNDQLRDLIVKTIALHSVWQVIQLKKFGLPVLIFIDEPSIRVYGKSSYITVTKEAIKEDLEAVFQAVHSAGALAGVHCCDAIDWSILFESSVEVVNFDAYNYFSSIVPFIASLKEFLKRGGLLAWGVVPTLDDLVLDEDGASLLAILDREWKELTRRGVSRKLLYRNCIIAPACGTGLLDAELAEKIYALASSVSEKLRSREGKES
ncbi:hypothetical protein [Pelotomaculum propionicicum]|uniref:Cobalamin-independent methionine synthase MetE C-terminal/archaeal domain-containing protein n=1 Tax=Pelotomaculum propionicicum TaxID=258475 RepID=A0A4Y7RWM1_9FIRM|nr:hypothetical protein [Pelotomaculum propionicicum]TEB13119.1 hypothetical protein Pmgp_00415 [Pelotomaculum propionicicum]